MLEPPQTLPAEAARELEEERIGARRGSARLGIYSALIAFALLSFTMVMGVRDWRLLGLAYVVIGLAAAAGLLAVTGRPVGRQRYLVLICWTALLLILTRLFGPLIMVPSIAAGVMVPMVLNATDRSVYVVLIGSGVLVVVLALELAGVIPSSYLFAAGLMCVQPQLAELPRFPTLALLTLSQLGAILIMLRMVVQIRDRHLNAEKRLRLHDWYLKRLMR